MPQGRICMELLQTLCSLLVRLSNTRREIAQTDESSNLPVVQKYNILPVIDLSLDLATHRQSKRFEQPSLSPSD